MSSKLEVVAGHFAICRLQPQEPEPEWARDGSLVSVTRTADELSILCPEERVPEGIRAERGFRCLRVSGSLDFSEIGVLRDLLQPLAQAGISVLAFSTFDTDYLWIRRQDWRPALQALQEAGHEITAPGRQARPTAPA